MYKRACMYILEDICAFICSVIMTATPTPHPLTSLQLLAEYLINPGRWLCRSTFVCGNPYPQPGLTNGIVLHNKHNNDLLSIQITAPFLDPVLITFMPDYLYVRPIQEIDPKIMITNVKYILTHFTRKSSTGLATLTRWVLVYVLSRSWSNVDQGQSRHMACLRHTVINDVPQKQRSLLHKINRC